ncbi:hypothetical protein D3H55_14560 [Bacillus salacetis]|uniref:DUF4309 domain-containing protein n=1 Tax=Bacillus salacetis TaxID=2315464 RepID=A0A3A1QZH7_9BACI|nr:hypothetical protein [Bacillus salacetis]RIW31842.1 hypothetical protein D3H55_14560 [Bacillus salacetis]
MKKKLSFVVFFTVLFLAVGAFHYQGTKSTVSATNGVSGGSVEQQKESESTVSGEADGDMVEKQAAEKNNTPDETTDVTPDSSSAVEENDSVEEKPSEAEQSSSERETVMVGNEEYVDITDMKKFKDLAEFAQKHGARLYAIENSDCFAVIKGEEPLLFFSVGTVSAGVEDIAVLKDYMAFHGYSEETGIAGNIDVAAESGAKVDVNFNDGAGYYIFKEGNTIIINWA